MLEDFWEHLVDLSNFAVVLGTNLFIQSTILVGVGLIAACVVKGKGAALRSVIVRGTLVAVILCPMIALLLEPVSTSGLLFYLPQGMLRQETTPEHSPQLNGDTALLVHEDSLGIGRDLTVAPWNGESSAAVSSNAAERLADSEETAASAFFASIDWAAMFYIVLFLTWAFATSILLARLLFCHLKMARIRGDAQTADESITASCRLLADELKLKPPPVLISPDVRSPCLVGLFRAAILFPRSDAMDRAAHSDVFVHELAHMLRKDPFWNLLARTAVAILLFQPLLWRLARQIEQYSDEVCDDYVLRFASDRRSYARRLVDLADQFQPTSAEAVAGLGVITFKSSLGRRVQRILDTSRFSSLRTGWTAIATVIVLGALITGCAGLIGVKGKGRGAEMRAPETHDAVVSIPTEESRIEEHPQVTREYIEGCETVDQRER
ncbi:MAG: M56 family metallopeptidase, partial [bacterium]